MKTIVAVIDRQKLHGQDVMLSMNNQSPVYNNTKHSPSLKNHSMNQQVRGSNIPVLVLHSTRIMASFTLKQLA